MSSELIRLYALILKHNCKVIAVTWHNELCMIDVKLNLDEELGNASSRQVLTPQ